MARARNKQEIAEMKWEKEKENTKGTIKEPERKYNNNK
jgi:hypothetical protein